MPSEKAVFREACLNETDPPAALFDQMLGQLTAGGTGKPRNLYTHPQHRNPLHAIEGEAHVPLHSSSDKCFQHWQVDAVHTLIEGL